MEQQFLDHEERLSQRRHTNNILQARKGTEQGKSAALHRDAVTLGLLTLNVSGWAGDFTKLPIWFQGLRERHDYGGAYSRNTLDGSGVREGGDNVQVRVGL